MSTRSSRNSVSGTHFARRTKVDGSVTETAPNLYQATWIDSVTFGDNLKGWRELLRRGMSATTSMSGNKISAKYTPGYGRYEISKQDLLPTSVYLVEPIGHHLITGMVPGGDPSTISETKADAEAMGKFLRRVRDKQVAFQGGVFLGELGETLAMIRNPAKGLRGLVDEAHSVLSNVRRLGFRNSLSRTRVTEQLADAWLELQFGWKPLLRDIGDGCNALSQMKARNRPVTVRVTASHTTETVSSEGDTVHNVSNIAIWRHTGATVNRCMVIYRGALRLEAMSEAEMRRDLLGFNPSNFLPTIYQLIPWSFLIDYFSNVGDIVEGWSQLGTRLAWCNKTTRKEIELTKRSFSNFQQWNEDKPFVNPPTLVKLTFSPAISVVTNTVVTRTNYTQAMVPAFVLRVPSFGSLRWLNIAALVAGMNNDRKWVYGD